MAGSKEIRNKIKSVQSTRKITKAMEMVSASKMKKAQDRMRASRPYVERALQIAMHIAKANTEYKHPFLAKREAVKRIGAIVVTTDKGLCGGLNTNILRLVLSAHKEWRAKGLEVDYCAIGGRGLGFLERLGANVVSQAVQLGDRPHRDARRAGEGAARQVHGGRARPGPRVLHDVHQHDEAGSRGTGTCCRSPSSSARPAPARSGRRRWRRGRGTTSTSRTRRSCSTACCGAMSKR